MSPRFAPFLAVLAAAALFGSSVPAAKMLLGQVGPVTLAGLLYLGAFAGVVPWTLGRRPRRIDRANGWRLTGSVVAGGVLAPVCLLLAVDLAPALSASVWVAMEPIATALVAALFFREHLGARVVAAAVLVTVASIVVASPASIHWELPAILALLACVFWAIDNNCSAVIDALTPAQMTAVKGLAAGSVNLMLGLGLETPPAGIVIAAGLGLGAVSYGLSTVLYIVAAQAVGAVRSQLVFATAPLWGVLGSWLVVGEALTVAHLVAALLIAIAIVVMSTRGHGHEHDHEATVHVHGHRHDDGHHDHPHGAALPPTGHVHEHAHRATAHTHGHLPDIHHRHGHGRGEDGRAESGSPPREISAIPDSARGTTRDVAPGQGGRDR